mmetsp:Transcript_17545/g.60680  ORF Transcript_17545/g.60680 Transcript_17545/m.60680 type:complete len:341 (+) Transcript_17545:1091-2113(+)
MARATRHASRAKGAPRVGARASALVVGAAKRRARERSAANERPAARQSPSPPPSPGGGVGPVPGWLVGCCEKDGLGVGWSTGAFENVGSLLGASVSTASTWVLLENFDSESSCTAHALEPRRRLAVALPRPVALRGPAAAGASVTASLPSGSSACGIWSLASWSFNQAPDVILKATNALKISANETALVPAERSMTSEARRESEKPKTTSSNAAPSTQLAVALAVVEKSNFSKTYSWTTAAWMAKMPENLRSAQYSDCVWPLEMSATTPMEMESEASVGRSVGCDVVGPGVVIGRERRQPTEKDLSELSGPCALVSLPSTLAQGSSELKAQGSSSDSELD